MIKIEKIFPGGAASTNEALKVSKTETGRQFVSIAKKNVLRAH